jgi:putative ABC transport system permease protein
MLLAGAGLLIRSFWNLLQEDPGFRADGVLKAEYQLPGTRYPVNMREWPNLKEHHAFTADLLARARALPGVVSAAIAGNHPLDRGFTNSFGLVGRQAPQGGWPELSIRRVTGEYFETVGLPVVHGRLIDARDDTTAAPVIIINQAAAHRLFAGEESARALGAQIRLYGAARTIVGIVGNERIHGVGEAAPIAAYLPLAQAPSTNGVGVLLVRTAGDVSALATPVRAAINERDPSLAVFGLEPLGDTLMRSLSERRFASILLGTFAGLALLLGAVGIYGMLSYDLARRRQEIGVRLALGANPHGILRLVMGQSLRLAVIAAGLGIVGALGLSRYLSTLLFGVSPRDPVTLAVVAVALTLVALATTAVPAWRAAHTDPAASLRA